VQKGKFMRKELLRELKEIYKDNNKIKVYDFNGWNVHIKSIDKNISIWIENSNINCSQTDNRDDNDFYEIYIYEGLHDDLRQNKFIDRKYSRPRSDYKTVIKIIKKIIE